mgnify:CR=1 FL=1
MGRVIGILFSGKSVKKCCIYLWNVVLKNETTAKKQHIPKLYSHEHVLQMLILKLVQLTPWI